MDIVDPQTRSEIMRAVRQRGTTPELIVRSAVSKLGVRYRLNSRSLPGSPDLSNRRAGWAIYVHGCFWHGHPNCKKTKGGAKGRIPKSNRPYWTEKLAGNRKRDRRKERQLRNLGLRVLTIWECQLAGQASLQQRLEKFLGVMR